MPKRLRPALTPAALFDILLWFQFFSQTVWKRIEAVITALTRNPHGSIPAPSPQTRMESGFAAHPGTAVFRKR
jgi:hypothetical protein